MSHVLLNLLRRCALLSLGIFGLVSSAVTASAVTVYFDATAVYTGSTNVQFTFNETTRALAFVDGGYYPASGGTGQGWSNVNTYGTDTGGVTVWGPVSRPPYSGTVTVPAGVVKIYVQGVNGYNGVSTPYKLGYSLVPLDQTVTLSPNGGAASILTGQTFSGQATGAQAGNSYNISITSGSGGASINPSTGAYTVTAGPTGGLIHYKVWVSAGGGYARSSDAESNITVSLSKKVKVTIPANKGKYPVTYKLYQGGVEIGSHTQMPGASAFIVTIDVGANDGEVTMKSFTSGVLSDDGVIVEDVNGVVEQDLPDKITPSTDPQTVTPTGTTDMKAPGDSVSTKLPRTKVSWGSSGQSTDPSAQTDILTNKTYREGVEKQVEQSGIELKMADERPSESDMTSKGQAAKAEAEASLSQVGSSIATATAPEGEAGSFVVGSGTFSSMVSSAWNQAVIGLNPVVAWIKAIIRWAITLLYVFWVYRELDRKLVTSMMLPQAKGNPVIGGTGAQITGLAAAALISAALLTVPLLLWAAYTTPWDGLPDAGSIVNIAAAPIASSIPSVQIALKWLAWLLPLDMILAIPAMVLLVKKAGWAIILGVAALIRFIVP